jgi:hypothetical protein
MGTIWIHRERDRVSVRRVIPNERDPAVGGGRRGSFILRERARREEDRGDRHSGRNDGDSDPRVPLAPSPEAIEVIEGRPFRCGAVEFIDSPTEVLGRATSASIDGHASSS